MDEAAAKEIFGRTGWHLGRPDWVRDAALAASRLRTYGPGQFTCHAGDNPGGMYGVVDGGFDVLVAC